MTNSKVENLKSRYRDMMRRCYSPTNCNYKNYGAKGIGVCKGWRESRIEFINWALDNGYSRELSLDRIDNDGDYEPNNCRWVNKRTQNINKKSSVPSKTGFVGVTKHSSSYEGHIYYYGRVRGRDGKTLYTGLSKSLKEAVIMRNEFIIDNSLDNKLNVIPEEMED